MTSNIVVMLNKRLCAVLILFIISKFSYFYAINKGINKQTYYTNVNNITYLDHSHKFLVAGLRINYFSCKTYYIIVIEILKC